MTTHERCLDSSQLRRLAALDLPGPCVSIYLAPVRGTIGRLSTEETVHTLLRDARPQLTAEPWSLDGRAATRLLQPVLDMALASGRHDDEGAAVFVAADLVERFAVPGITESCISVGRRPDLLPAALAAAKDHAFHLLVLSQRRVELHRCTATESVPVSDADLPSSLEDALWYEHHSPSSNLHGGAHIGQDTIAAIGHGGDSMKDVRKDAIQRFIGMVDRALPPEVHDGPLPLVVAALEFEAAMLRDARPHRDLLLLTALGTPERHSIEELRTAAAAMLQERAEHGRPEALDRYATLAGTGRTCSGTPAVTEAAAHGQVGTLLVDPVDVAALTDDVRVTLTDAVAAVLATGAEVVGVPHGALGDEPVAALLRY